MATFDHLSKNSVAGYAYLGDPVDQTVTVCDFQFSCLFEARTEQTGHDTRYEPLSEEGRVVTACMGEVQQKISCCRQ